MPHPGFNVIGPVDANPGIGVTLRQLLRLLAENGCPVATLPRKAGLARDGHDETWRHLAVASPSALSHGINIVSAGLSFVGSWLLEPGAALLEVLRPDRLNVGLLWWEFPQIPTRWA